MGNSCVGKRVDATTARASRETRSHVNARTSFLVAPVALETSDAIEETDEHVSFFEKRDACAWQRHEQRAKHLRITPAPRSTCAPSPAAPAPMPCKASDSLSLPAHRLHGLLMRGGMTTGAAIAALGLSQARGRRALAELVEKKLVICANAKWTAALR